jgi:hypothetical protein
MFQLRTSNMTKIRIENTGLPTPYYLTDPQARAISWIVQTNFLPRILIATT